MPSTHVSYGGGFDVTRGLPELRTYAAGYDSLEKSQIPRSSSFCFGGAFEVRYPQIYMRKEAVLPPEKEARFSGAGIDTGHCQHRNISSLA